MADDFDVVDALKHTVTYIDDQYNKDKLYVSISHEAKEIFISSVKDQIPRTAAIYDSLTRMISMSWQNNTTKDVVKQLYKASRSKQDLPGILANLIRYGNKVKPKEPYND